VDFDTGSSDLFLPGPQCRETCSGHTLYDPSESDSSSDTGRSFRLKFGDGSTAIVEGYTDVVSVAGLSVSRLYLLNYVVFCNVHLGQGTSGWRCQ
jgi:cathepsin D